jgi:hypothetical protein
MSRQTERFHPIACGKSRSLLSPSKIRLAQL